MYFLISYKTFRQFTYIFISICNIYNYTYMERYFEPYISRYYWWPNIALLVEVSNVKREHIILSFFVLSNIRKNDISFLTKKLLNFPSNIFLFSNLLHVTEAYSLQKRKYIIWFTMFFSKGIFKWTENVFCYLLFGKILYRFIHLSYFI